MTEKIFISNEFSARKPSLINAYTNLWHEKQYIRLRIDIFNKIFKAIFSMTVFYMHKLNIDSI